MKLWTIQYANHSGKVSILTVEAVSYDAAISEALNDIKVTVLLNLWPQRRNIL